MKFFKLFEQFKTDWVKIGSGTEGDVYSDGEYAYKVVNTDLIPRNIDNYLNLNLNNVVNIYNVKYHDDKAIIKMELLKPIDKSKFDISEYEKIQQKLWETFDEVSKLPLIIKTIKNSELKKAVESMYKAGIQLNKSTLDIGFHNLMYDPKTNEYKQIDFF
jgi:hypothetical protein